MKNIMPVLGTTAICALLLISCAQSPYGNRLQYVEAGKIAITLTDAPFPHSLVSEANVTIFKIDARLKSESETIENESNSPFQVLFEGETKVNLLELTNGVTKSFGETEVVGGSYDLVRVFVKDANVELTDGRIFDLKVPSGEQTGIKIFIKPELIVSGGLTSELLLDFDVSQSFIAKGSTNNVSEIKGFSFKPVIKASNMSVSGSLSGKVSTSINESEMSLEGAQLSVMAADTLNTTTFTDASGEYMVQGLRAGTYEVIAELDGYETQSTDEVNIVPGNETIQDFNLNE